VIKMCPDFTDLAPTGQWDYPGGDDNKISECPSLR
jgi:hypothetical protein